ncbi:2-oxoglutarate-dependent dioxygenase DAO-like [Silene latifolia]|uniref:2-oxoglutarate-dependent dioxygenase DAO-like n=1 Tax=Silene latifolia TaxID=37657 RepID=UPI003D7847AD
MEEKIPVFDLQNINENLAKLREVARIWGCFRLINHGVSSKLMADMKSTGRALFDRPVEIKKRIKEVVPLSGYRPTNARNPSYEAFAFHDVNPQTLSTFSSDLQLSTQQRAIMETYTRATSKLATDVANKLAISMGLANYTFEDWCFELRVNKYTTTPETIGSSGLLCHTDDAFLTILMDDECFGGLQVMNGYGTFVDVTPLPNSFVVNLGDTAKAWSNGELRDVEHRVQCKEVGIRLSTTTFLIPQLDVIVKPHPLLVKAGETPRYGPFTYRNLRKVRAEKRLFVGEEALRHL